MSRILLAFLLGLVVASCGPVPSLAYPSTVVSSGDTIPLFTTRIRMCQPVIREMPNWIESDPDDSTHHKPLRYSSAGSSVKIAR